MSKSTFATVLAITMLAVAASLTYSLMSGHWTSAKSAYATSNISAEPAASSSSASVAAQSADIITTDVVMPRTLVYALNSNNTILQLC
jgi:hypothetical protein